MFPEWHHAVPESAYFKVPETLKTFRMYSTSRYAPCATRLHRRCSSALDARVAHGEAHPANDDALAKNATFSVGAVRRAYVTGA